LLELYLKIPARMPVWSSPSWRTAQAKRMTVRRKTAYRN